MPAIINPFDAGGFTLADMTESLNLLPNMYGRVNELGIFADEGVTQTTVLVDAKEGVLNLLPSVPRGAPATVANRDNRVLRSFVVPHIPHNDVVLPEDIQGIRSFGSMDAADTLARVMEQRLMRVRMKHSQTLEFMRIQALKGILRDGAGVQLANFYTEFGVTKKVVDFTLGTASTDVGAKCREVLRHMKKNLNGELMSGCRALVSPGFWDKFIKHSSVVEAYKYYTANDGISPLRGDVRKGFKFHDIIFEEYDATFTLADGSTSEDAFANDFGMAFPEGTRDTFKTHYAPANWMETVNSIGIPMYARQVAREDGSGIDVFSQSNPFPICRRPKVLVEIRTSN